MKILLINKWVAGATKGEFYYPGTWSDTYELACTLSKFGHEITILTPEVRPQHLAKFQKEFGENLIKRGIRHEFAKTFVQFNRGFGAFRLRMFLDELRLLRSLKPDIIQYMQFGPSLIYPFAGKIPIIYYSCDQFNTYPKEREDRENTIKSWSDKNPYLLMFSNIIFSLLLKMFGSSDLLEALQKGSFFILKHPEGYSHLKSEFRKYSSKIFFVAKAVTPPNLVKDTKKSSRVKLLFLGSISYRKGVFDLVEALAKAKMKNLDVFIAGSGPQIITTKLKKEIKKRNLKINVFGSVNFFEKWTLMNKHDILCLPSYQDSYPSVILEAMYLGLPVITTRQIDTPIKDGISGLLVDAGNVEELTGAIFRLVQNNKLRNTLSLNAKRTVASLTWENQAKKLISIYEKLLPDFNGH